MYCVNCGSEISDRARFCVNCGADARGRRLDKTPVFAVIAVVAICALVFSVVNQFGTDDNGLASALPPSGEASSYSDQQINSIGDQIEFGAWRGSPIKWRVLDIQIGKALVISKDILALRQYDNIEKYRNPDGEIDYGEVKATWAESDIRAWLNSEFLNAAFTEEEQKMVAKSHIKNPDNAEYGTPGGKDTEDQVFLLSIDEANEYFDDADYRYAWFKMTEEDFAYMLPIEKKEDMYDNEYIEANLRRRVDQYFEQRWWLRSPGCNNRNAAFVGGSLDHYYSGADGYVSVTVGDIYVEGDVVVGISGARPALWLNLNAGN